MGEKHDTRHKPYVTCPYCGNQDVNSWEYHLKDGDFIQLECGECWGEFDVTCTAIVDYSTFKRGEYFSADNGENPPPGEEGER